MATRFAIVGRGWRARTYLRIARELADRFEVTGLLTRDPAVGSAIEAEWGVRTHRTVDALLADRPAFVVLAVAREATPGRLRELADRGVPILVETPPAPDLSGLRALRSLAGAPIQVAEQYRFQPLHAARLAIAESGRLGRISQTQLSVAHGYHGVDLLRRFLGLGAEPLTITARRFVSPIVAGPDRDGPPRDERVVPSEQCIATIDAGDRLGILDFTPDQYFSWIRGLRVLVRGDRGEIDGTTVRYLLDARTPVALELVRRDAGRDGNLEGLFHAGITAGADWVYRDPFVPARLTDDEIAIAECLVRMAAHTDGGPAFCDLAEGVQDQYLALAIERAAATARSIRISGHVWDTTGDGGEVVD